MKHSGSLVLLLAAPLTGLAQTAIFTDNFGNGSTFNGVSTPGGTPAASSSSYDFASSKTGAESIAAGHLSFGLSAATTSGFVEAQAIFTSTPVTLATVGDYINFTYTFTDTANLLAGGTSAALYTGLYNSGGNTPVAGTAGTSGNAVTLNTTGGSALATGNAASWQGYVARITGNGGTAAAYVRPGQSGAGTTSANQELIGNNFGSGAYNNPSGVTLGTAASTVALTAGSQYTVSEILTLSGTGQISLSDTLYSGVGTGGAVLSTLLSSSSAAGTNFVNSFDGLAIGIRNTGTSLNPQIDVNQITITAAVQPAPEPSTLALVGLGSLGCLWFGRQVRRPA